MSEHDRKNQDAERKPETSPEEEGAAETGAARASTHGAEGAPAGEGAGDAAPAGGGEAPSVEDLVPGLDGEVDEALAARLAELEAERERLQAERDEMERNWKYALAETENVRRRAERDRNDAAAYGGTKLARDLLAVHDNLDRALENADEDLRANHAAFVEGIELTRRELLNAFAKHRIEKHEPEKGKKFDPNLEQAMFEAPVPGAQPGTVIEVMQPGFTIAGRLLRPAMVGVAKAAPQSQQAAPEKGEGTGTDG